MPKLLTKGDVDLIALNAARRALAYSKPKIPSSTLQQAARVRKKPAGGGYQLYIPHYWAIYIHNGRGPSQPKSKTFLVWFRNPQDDPRIRRGYGVKRPPRRLSKREWDYWLKQNRKASKLGIPAPMIVTQYAGPSSKYKAGGPHPSKFWDNKHGMAGHLPYAKKTVATEVATAITNRIRSKLLFRAN